MSDLQDLIHRTTMDCLERGKRQERERIIKLLEVLWQKTQGTDLPAVVVLPDAIALIKGESN